MSEVGGISIRFEKGERRGPDAKVRLISAYTAVFDHGNATVEDRQFVLTDLADFCGFYSVQGPGLSADERAYREGQRSAFGRILSHLALTWEELRAYQVAARREALVNKVEGEL